MNGAVSLAGRTARELDAGGGVNLSGAREALAAVATRLDAGVAQSPSGSTMRASPRRCGVLGQEPAAQQSRRRQRRPRRARMFAWRTETLVARRLGLIGDESRQQVGFLPRV
jgi:hypothetical protein